MKISIFDKLVLFLQNLEQQEISYILTHNHEEAIMVSVAVPGERWEVEFLSDGAVEVEKFISNGEIAGEEALSEFFARYSEQEELAIESPQNIGLSIVS